MYLLKTKSETKEFTDDNFREAVMWLCLNIFFQYDPDAKLYYEDGNEVESDIIEDAFASFEFKNMELYNSAVYCGFNKSLVR